MEAITVAQWLALSDVPSIGIASIVKSAKKLNVPISQLHQHIDALVAIGWQKSQAEALNARPKWLDEVLNWLGKSEQHHFIPIEDERYPQLLREIAYPPLYLFAIGDPSLLTQAQLAVVGSRSASYEGLHTTQLLIAELVRRTNIVVTSGLALGIDACAHKTSLANNGHTIAVLGSGIDLPYPLQHKRLYQQICERGLVISEMPPKVKPTPALFPRRNRIISGLSRATLLCEATMKSGSLITARYALEQNRDVFAMPGSVLNKQTEGCHWLIKQGASLVDRVEDILLSYPSLVKEKLSQQNSRKISNQHLANTGLLDSVGYSATSVDTIAKRSGRQVSSILVELLDYEMRGLVSVTPEGYIKLRG